MSPLCRETKNFLVAPGRLLQDPLPTSSRDFRLRIEVPKFRSWLPGQFVMLRWGRHLIGRPFAIVDWQKKNSKSVLDVWVRRLGGGTEELFAEGKKGLELSLTLPLGLPLATYKNSGPTLFLSGGVGAASIYPLVKYRQKHLKKPNDFWVHGEKDQASLDMLLQKEKRGLKPDLFYFEDLKTAKKERQPGRITQALVAPPLPALTEKFSAIVACGPSAMLEALTLELAGHELYKTVPLYLGLEEKMACGIGFCFSCSVSTQEGLKRCCLEGPWFENAQLKNHFSFRKSGVVAP